MKITDVRLSEKGWAQPERDIPLYIRKTPEGYEGIRICKPEPDALGIAHGVVRFTGNACDAYCRAITTLTFQEEEYWKTCLLPDRYPCYEAAEGKLFELMGVNHSA